jgi:PIN domain nuclease of toxin-antitoxin system
LIVLDTHALLWLAASPEHLSHAAREAVDAEEERGVATISVQEIAYLAARGRIRLDRPPARWIADALRTCELAALPLTTPIALRAGALDPARFHGDPADRIIYATALEHGARLLSRDARITAFDPARVLW